MLSEERATYTLCPDKLTPGKKIFLLGRLYFVNTFFIAVATFTSDFVEKKRSTGMPLYQ